VKVIDRIQFQQCLICGKYNQFCFDCYLNGVCKDCKIDIYTLNIQTIQMLRGDVRVLSQVRHGDMILIYYILN